MSDESVLRGRAREALEAGKLPDRRPERIWGGAGSGAACAVCHQTVGEEEVELELQFTSDPDCGAANRHLHPRCFAAWDLERRNRGSAGSKDRSLPPSDDRGIIPGREPNPTNQGECG